MNADYDRAALARAVRESGVREGDAVFTLSNLGFFGVPEGGLTKANAFSTALGALRDAVGPAGTLLAPAFTYSFCRGEEFDPRNSPSSDGLYPELLREQPGAIRSEDPLFSVVALGPRAAELTQDPPENSFGPGSVWERLIGLDAIFCHLNFLMAPPIIHYHERRLGMTYRKDRAFDGVLVRDGERLARRAVYYSRDMRDPLARPYTTALEKLVEAKGLCRRARCGRGFVLGMRARDFAAPIEEALRRDPRFLTAASTTGGPSA